MSDAGANDYGTASGSDRMLALNIGGWFKTRKGFQHRLLHPADKNMFVNETAS